MPPSLRVPSLLQSTYNARRAVRQHRSAVMAAAAPHAVLCDAHCHAHDDVQKLKELATLQAGKVALMGVREDDWDMVAKAHTEIAPDKVWTLTNIIKYSNIDAAHLILTGWTFPAEASHCIAVAHKLPQSRVSRLFRVLASTRGLHTYMLYQTLEPLPAALIKSKNCLTSRKAQALRALMKPWPRCWSSNPQQPGKQHFDSC